MKRGVVKSYQEVTTNSKEDLQYLTTNDKLQLWKQFL